MAVNGVYNAATYCIDLWNFGDVASDDAVKGGSDGDQADLSYIDDFSANADNGVLSEFWQSSYEVISRANNVDVIYRCCSNASLTPRCQAMRQ